MTGPQTKPSTMSREAFVAAFGHVYEHSPWIAESAYDKGLDARHDTAKGLAGFMEETVATAGDDAKLALLRAHPDLAGKLAMTGALTRSSSREQSGARLDQCSPEEFAAFTELNARYREKFGFPFILAVRDHDRAAILRIFSNRVENDSETELTEALQQVNRIAALRIADAMSNGDDHVS